ncbi:uncharacterized protein LOC141643228 [Silene latifolia]|uniref:uncharacterized protein LOC141643228 n=1 Tax=Silene latifolia TaxID=37657 RepID=UPI003D782204
MSHFSNLVCNAPELRHTVNPITRLPGTTPHSPISLSDSEPEPDFDIDVEDGTHTFEPLFSAFPEDNHHHHHHPYHQHDVTFKGADLGSYFGSSRLDPQRRGLFNGGGSEVNLELGLGFGLGSSSQTNYEETRRFEGSRVVNLDSDTESDDGNLPDYDFDNNNNNNQGFGGVSDFDRPPFCWDYLGFNNRNVNEENDGGIDDDFLYNGSAVDEGDNVDAGVSTLFDAYQEREEQREIVIESDDDNLGGEDAVLELDWDTHFALNSFYSEVYDMDFTVDMYEAILGEIEEGMNDWRGSPPASKAVIESLPAIKLLLKDGGLKENEVVCTICRDEVSGEEVEVVRQLPCLHYYHGDCILPWLQIRNTCPICRYELPTDDAEYELRKRERNGENVDDVIVDELSLDSQVSYVFHAFL